MRTLRVVAMHLIAASAAGGQAAPVLELRSPATAADEFSRVVSVRELADGRLLVSDRRDNRIALVAFDGKPATPLGRVGSGPGEYRAAGALVALPGDSTALIDSRNGRWLLFAGGAIAGTVSRNGQIETIPVGVSATHEFRYGAPDNGLGATDSLVLLRTRRRDWKTDTIARVAAQTARQSAPKRDGSITTVRIAISPWTVGDQAILFDDGWLAIARAAPYAVDWIPPGGKLQRGKPFRASDPPFTDADKRAFMTQVAAATGKAAPIDSRTDWPDVVTAFTSDSHLLGAPAPALLAGPGGHLMVRRQPTATAPEQRYDVIDRSSTVVAQVVLGRNEAMIAAGKAHLYVVATDDDGIQRIRRYDWPLRGGR
jgi:hypothetical protein